MSIQPTEKTFDDSVVISNEVLNTVFPYENGFCSDPKAYIKREVEKIGFKNIYDKSQQIINENFNLPGFRKFINEKGADSKVQAFLKTGEDAHRIKTLYLDWSEMSIKEAIENKVF